MPLTRYCAIIGDMNRSRSLPDRAKVQRGFQKAIETINHEFKREIASRFVVTLGDEFQGLLHSPEKSYMLVRRFQELMLPVSFAFGVGLGTLSTALVPKAAVGMDGECFHFARAALLQAKEKKHEIVYGFDHPCHSLVNALVALLTSEWRRLTPRQREITKLMGVHKNQYLVARKLKISQPAVSKAYSSSIVKQLNSAETVLRSFLGSIDPVHRQR